MASRPLTSTPVDYQETLLFKTLVKRNEAKKILDKVVYLVDKVSPILETIGKGAFQDYTLHSPLHSRKLLHLAEFIIPEETLEQLSNLEIAFMIMSFYIHDIGMVVSQKRKEDILVNPDFANFLESNKDIKERIDTIRDDIASVPDDKKIPYEVHLAQTIDASITKYLRPKHAKRATYEEALRDFETERQDLFKCNDRSFRDPLIQVCSSHNEKSSVLTQLDEDGSPILPNDFLCGDQRLNLQYCAAVLRLADILDFDAERTPESLFRALGIEDKKLPGFKISLQEWNKQMAVKSILFTDTEIVVQADSTSPSIGQSVKSMCADIEREIRDTSSFILKAPKDVADKYKLNLPLVVRADIRKKGYADLNYSIHLDDKSIMTLLMGENLYERAQVALRELVQNSIDACVLRTKLEKTLTPEITVSVSRDADGRAWVLVRDNGIGMDSNVLSNYFFKIGKSYYQSADFKVFSKKKSINGFNPISRFGIGILSVFMIGDALKVTTQNGYSESDKKLRTIFIDDSDSLAFVNESTRTEQGTSIELRLKREQDSEEKIGDLFKYIQEVFVHPAVSINLVYESGAVRRIDDNSFCVVTAERKDLLVQNGVEVAEVDVSRFSETIRGRGSVFFFVNEDGSLSYYDKSHQKEYGLGLMKTNGLTTLGYVGNRLTVDGVVMRMKKMATLLRVNKQRFRSILDIDVISDEKVEYNVSRTKVVGASHPYIRRVIRTALAAGLKEGGYYDRMDEETKRLFSFVFEKKDVSTPLKREVFEKIEPLVKEGEFEVSPELVKSVAKGIEEDETLVRRYLYVMSNRRKKDKQINGKEYKAK